MVDRELGDFHPKYLASSRDRYGEGVEIDCPGHSGLLAPPGASGPGYFTDETTGRCRLQFWFSNPDDGEPPDPRHSPFYIHVYRVGPMPFASLSMWPDGKGAARRIDVPGHWRGYVIDGVVWDQVTFPAS